ncbi:MAG TPA: hypothetical protein PKN62_02365 [bacterium]|nr:hypothetical protein [bacterium]
MLNPKIHEQAAATLTANENSKKLLQAIYRAQNSSHEPKGDQPRIKVSSVISRMAFFYEKIRNAVDYKEEYLLRKEAIERILRRQILIEGTIKDENPEEISRHLLTELIRGGYLPNNQLPVSLIGELSEVIKKYLFVRDEAISQIMQESGQVSLMKKDLVKFRQEISKRNQLIGWLLAVCASEIESRLGNDQVLNQAINNLYQYLLDNVELEGHEEFSEDLPIQLYLSVSRNFTKLDEDMLSFILFKYYITDWQNLEADKWPTVAKKIFNLKEAINHQLNHPLAEPINKITKRYSVFMRVLLDVFKSDPVDIYANFKSDPKAFPRQIKKVCETSYGKAKNLLWRAAVRSIIYIFLTKSILVVALEIPANRFLHEPISWGALLFNAVFPAGLLFFSVLMTKLPNGDNTEKIIAGINELTFEENKRKDKTKLRLPQNNTKFLIKIFNVIYLLTSLVTFGAIIWALNQIHFTWVSTLIFLFFLVFVSFFIIRIKRVTNELKVIENKESLWRILFDVVTLPVMAVGKWLSEKFDKINVFVFLLDFIIEMPFKFFVDVAEDWTNYVNDRRNQIN